MPVGLLLNVTGSYFLTFITQLALQFRQRLITPSKCIWCPLRLDALEMKRHQTNHSPFDVHGLDIHNPDIHKLVNAEARKLATVTALFNPAKWQSRIGADKIRSRNLRHR